MPRVGVGVLVVHNGQVLLGGRHGSHGAETWSPPGGHLEFGEEPAECARREAWEEARIRLADLEPLAFTNDVFAHERLHYVTLFFRATLASGTPTVVEPEKCYEWAWFAWDALPEPLFLPLRHFVELGLAP